MSSRHNDRRSSNHGRSHGHDASRNRVEKVKDSRKSVDKDDPAMEDNHKENTGTKTPIKTEQNHPEATTNNTPKTVDNNELKFDEDSEPIKAEKKFTQRSRLFVGNLPLNTTEEQFKRLFTKYGETNEIFLNRAKGFGFIRLDTKHHAETAKACLDGKILAGRTLRCRIATHGAALRIKNLHSSVSNELLEEAFTQFGNVERAVVIVDDRGNSIGEGIVEFVRKPAAQQAMKRIQEGVFLLTTSPRPILAEALEQKDEEDGFCEKYITKTDEFRREREQGQRWATQGSFEHEFGMRWKQLYAMEKQQKDALKLQLDEAREKLELEMDNAMHEQQANLMRQDLMRRQEELRRLEEQRLQDQMRKQREFDMRRKNDDEQRRREEIMMRQQQEEIMRRQQDMNKSQNYQPPNMRGHHEDLLVMQQQELALREMQGRRDAPMQPPPDPPFGMGMDRQMMQQQGYGQNQQQQQQAMFLQQQRQSRFDQPPIEGGPSAQQQQMYANQMHGNQQQMGGMGRGPNQMGMQGAQGGRTGGGSHGNNMRNDEQQRGHMMDRGDQRERRDDSYDNKRSRRY